MINLDIKPYLKEEQIKKRVTEIGQELTKKLKDKQVVAICVLKGSFMFYSDLIREIGTDIPCSIFGYTFAGKVAAPDSYAGFGFPTIDLSKGVSVLESTGCEIIYYL
jgi:hypothetical protein